MAGYLSKRILCLTLKSVIRKSLSLAADVVQILRLCRRSNVGAIERNKQEGRTGCQEALVEWFLNFAIRGQK